MLNPYHILEVPQSASAKDIHSAFRRKAKDLHPDTHADAPEAELAFKQLTQAYALLNDPANRQLYDRGFVDFFGQPFDRADSKRAIKSEHNGNRANKNKHVFNWTKLRRGGNAADGLDVKYELNVPFETAVCGGKTALILKTGKKISVNIPAGARTGQVLRLKSQGTSRTGFGTPGDALISLTIDHSPLWLRDGDDIRMRARIDLKTAVMGGTIRISTPKGEIMAKVPTGSNTGARLRIKGCGIQFKDSPGDLLVRLEIVLDDPKSAALRRFVQSL